MRRPWLPVPDPLGILEKATHDAPVQLRDPLRGESAENPPNMTPGYELCLQGIEPLDDSKAELFEALALYEYGLVEKYPNIDYPMIREAGRKLRRQIDKASGLRYTAAQKGIELVTLADLHTLDRYFAELADMVDRVETYDVVEDYALDPVDKWITEQMYTKFHSCLAKAEEK